MAREDTDNAPNREADTIWSAWARSWEIPVALLSFWWSAAEAMWLPSRPFGHHHSEHDQLDVPEPLEQDAKPALFA